MRPIGKAHKQVAAKFALEKASDFHDAFGSTTTQFNKEPDRIKALPANEDLKQALVEYNKSVDPQFRFDVQKCTFEDVIAELERARKVYKHKAEGGSGVLHRIARSAGDYADLISGWTELIPTDYGLTVLSGGLKILFIIAHQNAANRDKIFEAFEDIPELMLSVKTIQNQWSTVPSLREEAVILYETVARALARLIVLLNGSINSAPGFSKRIKITCKKLGAPGRVADEIQAILNKVNTQAALFHRCLALVRDQRNIETGDDVKTIKATTERIETKIQDLKRDSDKYNAPLIEMIKTQQEGPPIMKLLHQTIIVQPIYDFPPPCFSAGPGPLLNQIELYEILGVSPQYPPNDLQLVLKELSRFSVSAQSQAQQLFTSRDFGFWMASKKPETLLVHGNFGISDPGRITAVSVLYAMFALQLRGNCVKGGQTIVLHHFCGLHASHYNAVDSLSGPSGLIRSILAQLLQSGRLFNLGFINTVNFAHELENHSLEMLCHTFHELIVQLPRQVSIICILDGLSEFTSERFGGELAVVLHILNRLNSTFRNFALLVTNPLAQDRRLSQQLTVNYQLQLQQSAIEDGYCTGFTERSFPGLVSQEDRLDYFRMRVRQNRAAEQNKYNTESEDDSLSSE